MTRIQSIQVLRCVAALSVVVLHCAVSWHEDAGGTYPEMLRLGAFGVDLFFVISGFIICTTARAATSAADFLRKRFVRVAPVYYIQTAPYVLVGLVTGTLALPALATSLLFWPVWGAQPSSPLLGVGWTLSFEMLFYTSFAGAMCLGGRGAAAFLVAYVGAVALNMGGAGGAFMFLGSPLLAEFLLGVLIAIASERRKLPARGAAAILFACAMLALRGVGGLVDTWAGPPFPYLPTVAFARLICAGLPCAMIVWGALQLEPWCRGRLVSALSYLGDASYSIYLAHLLAVMLVGTAWRRAVAPPIAMPFVEYLCGVTAGVLAFELVEKPLLAFLRRLTSAQKVRHSVAKPSAMLR